MLLHHQGESRTVRPLTGSEKTALALSGFATIALCYAFSIFLILALLVLLLGELVVWVGAARVGATSQINPVIRRHGRLLKIFLRSFWLPTGKEYRLVLAEKDAPRLFAFVTQLARHFEMPPPREISVEMSTNAWVRLEGYRRGSGRTILTVGYDLLASLSEAEIQAVLAHEMGHAKFIRRGPKRWLELGVARIASVTARLSEQAEAYRSSGKKFHLAEALLSPSDSLTRMASRLLAAYSRQDEFEADRIGAELFGSASMRSALVKLTLLQEKVSRVPWAERVAQLEAETGFSHWLVHELRIDQVPSEIPKSAHDPYSTHPSLGDRIAALPPDDARVPDTNSALALLSEPDRVAENLIAEVHRVAALVEQEDSTALTRWIRKDGKTVVRGRFWTGIGIIIVGIALALGFLTVDRYRDAALSVAFFGVVGVLLSTRVHRDRMQLPVPRYSVLKKAWEAERPGDFAEQESRIETELTQLLAALPKKKQKLSRLTQEGASALATCDYLRAQVAGRMAISLNNKNVEGVLVYLTAMAGLGLWDHFGQNLEFIRSQTALATPSTSWGAAWALFLAGDWARAEGLLLQAVERHPNNTTFLAMLAATQARRNKLQSAVLNAANAADLEPDDTELAKLAINLALDTGRLREADARLRTIQAQANTDVEIALCLVELHLMKHEYDEARKASDSVRAADSSAPSLIRLGHSFQTGRQDDSARQFYSEALNLGHYPEALLGLARLATNEKRREDARELLGRALNTKLETGLKGRTGVQLFHALVGQLSLLEEPIADCKAWIVTCPAAGTPPALAGVSLMVYALTRYAAEEHLDFVLKAMEPDSRPKSAAQLQWRDAPADQQPLRPVREGIQFVL
jgi:Zn-dependent protease with chaperone function/tetratricopeptide (TPR) repeat protein